VELQQQGLSYTLGQVKTTAPLTAAAVWKYQWQQQIEEALDNPSKACPGSKPHAE
jgi:hypothetical protein